MTYKGFVGVATIDMEAGILFGRVVNTRSVITFQSENVAELEKEFRTSVDVYLEACEEEGITPERPVAGNISLRTTPELHAAVTTAAAENGVSVNRYISGLLAEHVAARRHVIQDSGTNVALRTMDVRDAAEEGRRVGPSARKLPTPKRRNKAKA